MPSLSAAILVPAVLLTAAAALGTIPAPPAVALLAVASAVLLADLLTAPARAIHAQLGNELRAWGRGLVNDRSARASHDIVPWPRRALHDVALALEEAGLPDAASAVLAAAARCDAAAIADPALGRTADYGDPSGGSLGLVGGAARFAPARAERPLRHFSVERNLPEWLGPVWRERFARLLRPVDLVRLLHTPQIERRALIATLWLRAAFVLAAPLSEPVSLTGQVPLAGDATTLATVVYWIVLAEALATAAFAGRVADHVIGRTVRWSLLAFEQTLAIALVAAAPCWACAVFAAGPIVWFEKREWSLWKIPAWGAVNLGAFVLVATGGSALEQVTEALIAGAIILVIADSYGLMAPAVATTLVAAWRQERRARQDVQQRTRASRVTMRDAIAEATATLERAAAERPGRLEPARVEDLLRALARAEVRVDEGTIEPRRRPMTLLGLCAQAIATTGVPPAGTDPGAELHATQIDPRPAELGNLRAATPGTGKAIERLVKRIVAEAVAHGRGLLATRIELAGGDVLLTFANEVHPEGLPGATTGRDWAARLASALPDARLEPGREEEFNGLLMWVVRVRLGPTCFDLRGPVPAGADWHPDGEGRR